MLCCAVPSLNARDRQLIMCTCMTYVRKHPVLCLELQIWHRRRPGHRKRPLCAGTVLVFKTSTYPVMGPVT